MIIEDLTSVANRLAADPDPVASTEGAALGRATVLHALFPLDEDRFVFCLHTASGQWHQLIADRVEKSAEVALIVFGYSRVVTKNAYQVNGIVE